MSRAYPLKKSPGPFQIHIPVLHTHISYSCPLKSHAHFFYSGALKLSLPSHIPSLTPSKKQNIGAQQFFKRRRLRQFEVSLSRARTPCACVNSARPKPKHVSTTLTATTLYARKYVFTRAYVPTNPLYGARFVNKYTENFGAF